MKPIMDNNRKCSAIYIPIENIFHSIFIRIPIIIHKIQSATNRRMTMDKFNK